jgi:hypothetical protein
MQKKLLATDFIELRTNEHSTHDITPDIAVDRHSWVCVYLVPSVLSRQLAQAKLLPAAQREVKVRSVES